MHHVRSRYDATNRSYNDYQDCQEHSSSEEEKPLYESVPFNTPSHPNRASRRAAVDRSRGSPEAYLPVTEKLREHHSSSKDGKLAKYLCISVLCILCIGVLCFIVMHFGESKVEYNDTELVNKMKSMKTKIKEEFPSQDDELWSHIFRTMLDSFSRTRPIVLLLLDHGDNQEEKTNNCLVAKIAKEASQLMKKDSQEPFIIDGSDPPAELEGKSFVTHCKERIEKHGCMVIKHLNRLPSNFVQDLHYICDVECPLAKPSIYFLTMSVTNLIETPTDAAENTLNELWSGKINDDYLLPLVTRLTDQVAFVKAEKSLLHKC